MGPAKNVRSATCHVRSPRSWNDRHTGPDPGDERVEGGLGLVGASVGVERRAVGEPVTADRISRMTSTVSAKDRPASLNKSSNVDEG